MIISCFINYEFFLNVFIDNGKICAILAHSIGPLTYVSEHEKVRILPCVKGAFWCLFCWRPLLSRERGEILWKQI